VSAADESPQEDPIMKALWLSLPAWVVFVTAAGAAEKDVEHIQGTWTAESLILDGNDFYADGKSKVRLVFKGEKVTVEGNDEVRKETSGFSFKLDQTTTPRLIDIKITDGEQKDTLVEGIYELKGDELKICVRIGGKERPTKFESPEGSNLVLVVLKRQKP